MLISKNLPRFEKVCNTGAHCFCSDNFMLPTHKNSQKRVKNQKSTDKHLSFDGLIKEDIDLSDIYLAVLSLNDGGLEIQLIWSFSQKLAANLPRRISGRFPAATTGNVKITNRTKSCFLI